MKKTAIVLLLTLLSAFLLFGCQEKAPKASPVDDFIYEFKDGEAIITGYKGTDLEIVIPSVIEKRPVTVIGEGAFQKYDMKSIYIPDSVI